MSVTLTTIMIAPIKTIARLRNCRLRTDILYVNSSSWEMTSMKTMLNIEPRCFHPNWFITIVKLQTFDTFVNYCRYVSLEIKYPSVCRTVKFHVKVPFEALFAALTLHKDYSSPTNYTFYF